MIKKFRGIFATLQPAERSLEKVNGRLTRGKSLAQPIVDRNVDTLLTSLIAAMVAYSGNAPRSNPDELIRLPRFDDLAHTLTLLARLALPLESRRGLAPEEGVRAIHAAMEEFKPDVVRLLLSAISQYSPQEAEPPQPYLARLAENLIFEFLVAEFAAGTLTPLTIKPTLDRLANILVTAGKYSTPESDANFSTLAAAWSIETYREKLSTRFWLELPPREKSQVLRGPELWSVPVLALRQTLGRLAETGADAPRREARYILLNYAKHLEDSDPRARRAAAAGLNELASIIESLWPNQLPEDLSRHTLVALQLERNPQTSASLATLLEALCGIVVARGDYAGFETILGVLEQASREHTNLAALAKRLLSQDRWVVLVDASLASRTLDPALPRLLARDPERLLDRLASMLAEEISPEEFAGITRLLKTIGIVALSALEARLEESRPHRVSAAIKLLAATDPDRLLRGLTRALPNWEWNLQDLAVTELSRPGSAPKTQSAAFVFCTLLPSAHPLVVPMMIDQIGLAGELAAIPQLMEMASGEHRILRDQFVRIKAIEALGRLRATEAIQLLHILSERRSGIAYAEPAGLRAAAHDALEMIGERPATASMRATFDTPAPNSPLFAAPRRYLRVPLDAPLHAQIGVRAAGASAGSARVKTISLGGAYLESPQKFKVGDSVEVEVRSGFRKIQCTAVVRNTTPNGGGGVEFVHMTDDNRTKLRKLVLRNLSNK
jgi:hypothetical protein